MRNHSFTVYLAFFYVFHILQNTRPTVDFYIYENLAFIKARHHHCIIHMKLQRA